MIRGCSGTGVVSGANAVKLVCLGSSGIFLLLSLLLCWLLKLLFGLLLCFLLFFFLCFLLCLKGLSVLGTSSPNLDDNLLTSGYLVKNSSIVSPEEEVGE